MRRTLGSLIPGLLARQGVDTVFGIPGVHNIELYRGLPGSGLRHITGRHEQGLGFMADGYARIARRPGVCFTITGPGLTNITTALGQAYGDSIPLFVIASGAHRDEGGQGRGYLHELEDQLGVAARVSGWARRLESAAALPDAIGEAFSVLRTRRPRPAYLEIPRDLLAGPASDPTSEPALSSSAGGTRPTAGGDAAPGLTAEARRSLEAVAERLRRSRSPLLVAGGGAIGAAAEVRSLAERLAAPLVMSVNARGLLPPGHPLAVPASPSLDAVRALMAEADVVLAIGSEWGPTDFDMYGRGDGPPPRQLLRIDLDGTQLRRGAPAAIAIEADSRRALQHLATLDTGHGDAVAGARRAETTRSAARAELPGSYPRLVGWLDALRAALPEATLVGDSTQPVYAGNLYFEATAPGRWFNSATGYGTLGYALPAATGAWLADPARPVICLVGDGGLQFTLGELAVPGELQCHLLIVVWNNHGYREIEHSMRAVDIVPEGVSPRPPLLSALAEAYGYAWRKVASDEELQSAVRDFSSRRQVMLLEVKAEAWE